MHHNALPMDRFVSNHLSNEPYSKKPKFFSQHSSFHDVNIKTMSETAVTKDLKGNNSIYAQGNWKELNEFFKNESKKSEIRVMYFGDNLKTDTMAVNIHTDWLPATIVEEMEESWHKVIVQPSSSSKKKNKPSVDLKNSLYRPVAVSKHWGSFFQAGPNSKENSYWHQFVMSHSCLTVADLSVISQYPIDFSFKFQLGTHHSYHPSLPPIDRVRILSANSEQLVLNDDGNRRASKSDGKDEEVEDGSLIGETRVMGRSFSEGDIDVDIDEDGQNYL